MDRQLTTWNTNQLHHFVRQGQQREGIRGANGTPFKPEPHSSYRDI